MTIVLEWKWLKFSERKTFPDDFFRALQCFQSPTHWKQDRPALWTLCGFYAEGESLHHWRRNMQVFHLHDPDRPRSGRTSGLGCLGFYCCAQRKISQHNTNSRTCRSSPRCTRCLVLCGGFPCKLWLCRSRFHSNPPPSNSETHSHFPCTRPKEGKDRPVQMMMHQQKLKTVLECNQ